MMLSKHHSFLNSGVYHNGRHNVPTGTFVGVYSGELITDGECERRAGYKNPLLTMGLTFNI